MQRKSGFTLLELLIVIAIIAILCSFVIPALRSSQIKTRIALTRTQIQALRAALNPEFRSSLGAAGQIFIKESRTLATIGAHYDRVYRHALSRKKTINPGAGTATLQVAPYYS